MCAHIDWLLTSTMWVQGMELWVPEAGTPTEFISSTLRLFFMCLHLPSQLQIMRQLKELSVELQPIDRLTETVSPELVKQVEVRDNWGHRYPGPCRLKQGRHAQY